MKSLVSLILFAMLAVAVLLCTSCTEEIFIDRWLKADTIYLDRVKSLVTSKDTIVIRDTVEIRVVVNTRDTVFQVVTKDSVIIREVEKIVYHTDTVTVVDTDTVEIVRHDTVTVTVYDRTVTYLDTAYVMINIRNVTYIPNEILPHVQEFGSRVREYNKTTLGGGHMVIQYTDDLPGEGWVSHSYWIGGPTSSTNPYAQMVIEISSSLPPELHRASILRELSRLQLKKKYVTDVNKIMSPLFPATTTITKSHLDVLFN